MNSEPNPELIVAAHSRNYQKIKLLLQSGVDVNVRDRDGWTALANAAARGHAEMVRVLLENGADASLVMEKDGWSGTALEIATGYGYLEVVSLLLPTTDINKQYKYGDTLLHRATITGQKHVVEYLISKGADVNLFAEHNDPPLFHACWEGNLETVKLLINNSARLDFVTTDGETAIDIAKKRGHDKIVSYLQNVHEEKS